MLKGSPPRMADVLAAAWAVLGILAAAWGTWLNSTSALAATPQFAAVLPPPPADLAAEPVSLPAFRAAASELGVTRQANLTTESPQRSRVDVRLGALLR